MYSLFSQLYKAQISFKRVLIRAVSPNICLFMSSRPVSLLFKFLTFLLIVNFQEVHFNTDKTSFSQGTDEIIKEKVYYNLHVS